MPDAIEANGAMPLNDQVQNQLDDIFGIGALPQPEGAPTPKQVEHLEQPGIEAKADPAPDADTGEDLIEEKAPEGGETDEVDPWVALDMDQPTEWKLAEDGTKVVVKDAEGKDVEVELQDLVDARSRGPVDVAQVPEFQAALNELAPIRETYQKETLIAQSLRRDLLGFLDEHMDDWAPNPAYGDSDDKAEREWYREQSAKFNDFKLRIAQYFGELEDNANQCLETSKAEAKFDKGLFTNRILSKFPRLRGNKSLQRAWMAEADAGRKAVGVSDKDWKNLRRSPELLEAFYFASFGKRGFQEKRSARAKGTQATVRGAGRRPAITAKPMSDVDAAVSGVMNDVFGRHMPKK